MHVYIRFYKDTLESKRMKFIYLKQIKKTQKCSIRILVSLFRFFSQYQELLNT